MDNNLLGLTTLANQSQSLTPLVTNGKGQQLLGDSNSQSKNQFMANNMSHSRIDGASTTDFNNSKRSPFQSSKKHNLDESNDMVSQNSNYDQTTLFNSPGLNKSVDKQSSAKLQKIGTQAGQNNNNNLYSTFGSNNTSMPNNTIHGSAQKQQHMQTFGSPDKSNVKNAVRRGSQARSNSSRDSSGGGHRHGSANRRSNLSANRKNSYNSTDQDSQERSFTYPCQAFKQFLLAVREGKIDMKDLNNSPFLIDYLTMQAQIGGGSGGAGDSKPFSSSLRASTASNRSGSKNRDHSKSNKKGGANGGRSSNLGDSSLLKNPRDSIIEEEEDDGNMPGSNTHNTKQRNNLLDPNSSKANVGRGASPQKIVSPQKQLKSGSGVAQQQQPNLSKHNFKEDSKQNEQKPNQSPLKQSHQPQQQQQQPSEKKQRRGRNDRSTSGDERAGGADNDDVRFDEKGRPIKNNQLSSQKPKQGSQAVNKVGVSLASDDEKDQNNNEQQKSKNRRGRRDRDSSVSSSLDSSLIGPSAGANNNDLANNSQKNRDNSSSSNKGPRSNSNQKKNPVAQSPNEPRSISKLPKPTTRDDQPPQIRQSMNKLPQGTALPQIDERLNSQGDGGEDGTFRDYSNLPSSNSRRDGEDTNRLPIFDKNTDFKTDADYSINALKDNQTKKYLKNKASPMKNKQFREDEDQDNISSNIINLNDEEEEDRNNLSNQDQNQSEDNQLNPITTLQDEENNSDANNNYRGQYQDPAKVGITMIQKKTPNRESRKVKSQLGGDNTGSKIPSSGINIYGQDLNNTLNSNNDRAMRREDLDGTKSGTYDNNDRRENSEDQRNSNNLQQSEKKQRRGRANRGGSGNGSSEVSLDRQPVVESRLFDSSSRNQVPQLGLMGLSNKSASRNQMEKQLTIEEHLSTYRSKTSSQMNANDLMKSARSFNNDNESDNSQDEKQHLSRDTQQKSPSKSNKNQADRSSKNYNNDSTNKDKSNRNFDQHNDIQSPTKSNRNQDQDKTGKSRISQKSKKQYQDDEDLNDRQDSINSGRQESSRYRDEYNQSSSRLDKTAERKRQNRRSNNNVNSSENDQDSHDNDRDNANQIRQSQKSLNNLANTNYDEYNYSSFGQQNTNNQDDQKQQQQNQQQMSSGKKQRRDRGSRGRSNDSGSGSGDNNKSAQRSSLIKNSLQPIRGNQEKDDDKSHQYGSNNNPQYQTNYSSTAHLNDRNSKKQNTNKSNSNNNTENDKQKFERYQSKLKDLEAKLKKQVQENPSKPLDYKLIQEINDEAARTIQMQFKLKKAQKMEQKMRDDVHRHGNLVDRTVQTDPINLHSLAMKNANGMSDMDKFKKFFFAVFYTYMMMNTIMSDVFKREQPPQTQNQFNWQDYQNYLNTRQNRQQNKGNNNQ
eukprot:403348607